MVSAGHPYPVLCDTSGCRLMGVDGFALGIADSASYEVRDLHLQLGGVLVAYTDGLLSSLRSSTCTNVRYAQHAVLRCQCNSRAVNCLESRADGDQFGEDRLLDAVKAMRGAAARDIAEHVVDEALRHSGGRFVDDVAVLVLKRS